MTDDDVPGPALDPADRDAAFDRFARAMCMAVKQLADDLGRSARDVFTDLTSTEPNKKGRR